MNTRQYNNVASIWLDIGLTTIYISYFEPTLLIFYAGRLAAKICIVKTHAEIVTVEEWANPVIATLKADPGVSKTLADIVMQVFNVKLEM